MAIKSKEFHGPFEEQLQQIEKSLESELGALAGKNLRDNIIALRNLKAMNKFALEAYYSKYFLISLNDQEYERLQAKINSLLLDNENAAKKQGLNI